MDKDLVQNSPGVQHQPAASQPASFNKDELRIGQEAHNKASRALENLRNAEVGSQQAREAFGELRDAAVAADGGPRQKAVNGLLEQGKKVAVQKGITPSAAASAKPGGGTQNLVKGAAGKQANVAAANKVVDGIASEFSNSPLSHAEQAEFERLRAARNSHFNNPDSHYSPRVTDSPNKRRMMMNGWKQDEANGWGQVKDQATKANAEYSRHTPGTQDSKGTKPAGQDLAKVADERIRGRIKDMRAALGEDPNKPIPADKAGRDAEFNRLKQAQEGRAAASGKPVKLNDKQQAKLQQGGAKANELMRYETEPAKPAAPKPSTEVKAQDTAKEWKHMTADERIAVVDKDPKLTGQAREDWKAMSKGEKETFVMKEGDSSNCRQLLKGNASASAKGENYTGKGAQKLEDISKELESARDASRVAEKKATKLSGEAFEAQEAGKPANEVVSKRVAASEAQLEHAQARERVAKLEVDRARVMVESNVHQLDGTGDSATVRDPKQVLKKAEGQYRSAQGQVALAKGDLETARATARAIPNSATGGQLHEHQTQVRELTAEEQRAIQGGSRQNGQATQTQGENRGPATSSRPKPGDPGFHQARTQAALPTVKPAAPATAGSETFQTGRPLSPAELAAVRGSNSTVEPAFAAAKPAAPVRAVPPPIPAAAMATRPVAPAAPSVPAGEVTSFGQVAPYRPAVPAAPVAPAQAGRIATPPSTAAAPRVPTPRGGAMPKVAAAGILTGIMILAGTVEAAKRAPEGEKTKAVMGNLALGAANLHPVVAATSTARMYADAYSEGTSGSYELYVRSLENKRRHGIKTPPTMSRAEFIGKGMLRSLTNVTGQAADMVYNLIAPESKRDE